MYICISGHCRNFHMITYILCKQACIKYVCRYICVQYAFKVCTVHITHTFQYLLLTCVTLYVGQISSLRDLMSSSSLSPVNITLQIMKSEFVRRQPVSYAIDLIALSCVTTNFQAQRVKK